jgi:hypothetical protein
VEARAGEFDADDDFLLVPAGLDVDDAALRRKLLLSGSRVGCYGDVDFELYAQLQRVPSSKRGAAPANIFAGSVLLERESREEDEPGPGVPAGARGMGRKRCQGSLRYLHYVAVWIRSRPE